MKIKNLENLDTPCLLLDKKLLEKNCENVRQKLEKDNVTLRPHVKTPKSIEIARVALGKKSGPITVSTLKEAEFFASAGFKDILYAVSIVPNKLSRLKNIQNKYNCKIICILDSLEIAKKLMSFSKLNNFKLNVLIEIDCGEGRTGLKFDSNIIYEISRILKKEPLIDLLGVLTHAGHSYSSNKTTIISKIAGEEKRKALHAKKIIEEVTDCSIVSIGSTPTLLSSHSLNGITEIRAGIYMFWDLAQASRGICNIEDIAVTVLSTVISHNHYKNRIILDAGALALSHDISSNHFRPNFGYGLVCEPHSCKPLLNLSISEVYQEHGVIDINDTIWFKKLPIGSFVRILPNHSCITCAGYENYNVIQNNEIRNTWSRTNGW